MAAHKSSRSCPKRHHRRPVRLRRGRAASRGRRHAILGDRHEGDDAAVREINLFDFIAGQMQELALGDRNDLQMRLEQRKIPRPQRGQETIAVMLVLICHFGLTPPSARRSRRVVRSRRPVLEIAMVTAT